jgi:general secretion pathway protein M
VSELPTGTRGRIAAILLLVIVLLFAHLSFVQPLLDLYSDNDQGIADKQEMIEHLQHVAAELPSLRKTGEQQRDRVGGGFLTLEAPSDAVAVANLLSMLKDIVARGGATVTSAEGVPVQPQGKFHRIGVRFSLTGTLDVLTTVLKGVDDARPVLFVDNLQLRAAGVSGPLNPVAGRPLSISMDAYGFRLE